MAEASPAAADDNRQSARPASYFDLMDALAAEGCAICRLAVAASERYLDDWIYETFTDVGNRDALVKAGGFCTTHTWALAEPRAAFQVAVAYRSVLLAAVQAGAVESATPEGQGGAGGHWAWWQRLFGQEGSSDRGTGASAARDAAARWHACPACRARIEQEDRILAAFAKTCGEPDLQAAFGRSSGFCLIHFRAARRACAAAQPAQVVTWLDEAQRACLQRMVAQLDELIRKHDYRFSDEPQGEEMRSWRLAAELVAGRRGMW
jgi:hypothetical protein